MLLLSKLNTAETEVTDTLNMSRPNAILGFSHLEADLIPPLATFSKFANSFLTKFAYFGTFFIFKNWNFSEIKSVFV